MPVKVRKDGAWVNLLSTLKNSSINVVTTDVSLLTGQLVVVNNASLTLTLPSSPNVGDYVEIRIVGTNYCTIARNGSKIESLEENLTIDLTNGYVNLVYINATLGWTIASSGIATISSPYPLFAGGWTIPLT